MEDRTAQLVVVLAPDTAEEASRHFSALLSGGYHPVMDYGTEGHALANYPVLVPQAELKEAQAFLRGLRHQPAPPPKWTSVFAAGGSDRPVGPLPPWTFKATAGKALGVLVAMLVLVGGVLLLVEILQFLVSLKNH